LTVWKELHIVNPAVSLCCLHSNYLYCEEKTFFDRA